MGRFPALSAGAAACRLWLNVPPFRRPCRQAEQAEGVGPERVERVRTACSHWNSNACRRGGTAGTLRAPEQPVTVLCNASSALPCQPFCRGMSMQALVTLPCAILPCPLPPGTFSSYPTATTSRRRSLRGSWTFTSSCERRAVAVNRSGACGCCSGLRGTALCWDTSMHATAGNCWCCVTAPAATSSEPPCL